MLIERVDELEAAVRRGDATSPDADEETVPVASLAFGGKT